jgi:hypothetical protein
MMTEDMDTNIIPKFLYYETTRSLQTDNLSKLQKNKTNIIISLSSDDILIVMLDNF